MKEIWKDIKGYEGRYQVSNKGRIKRVPNIIIRKNGVKMEFKERMRKLMVSDYGYNVVVLTKNNKHHTHQVHRLVAQAFVANPNNEKQVNHLDFNKLNNCVDNLEWVSSYQNALHYQNKKGIQYNIHDLIESYKELKSARLVGKKHGISKQGVVDILKRNHVKMVENKGGMAYNARGVGMYSLNNEFIRSFKCLKNAEKWLKNNGWPKARSSNITMCHTGKYNKSYGYKWKAL